MAKEQVTKHLVVDVKTGFTYGIKVDGDGNCKAVQPLNTVIEAFDGRVVSKFGPLVDEDLDPNPNGTPPDTMPYGKTSYCVELTNDGSRGKVFTIAWPKKAEADKGALPLISSKETPEDLSKSILAPPAKNAKVDNEEALKGALTNIEGMIGLDSAKRDIKQNIALARFNRLKEELGLSTKSISRHMVFTGNPGTGKTTFAREVAKVYHALGFIEKPEVHEVKREDLVAGFVGQTALKTKEQIDKAKGGILFIDEAYALSREQGPGGSNDFGREAIDTLVAAMENMREDLIVVVAGYPEPMKRFIDANEGLKSRFMTYIDFDDYDVPQLSKIMDSILEERGNTMSPEAKEYAVKLIEEEKTRAQKDFGNGRTVRNLVEKAEAQLATRMDSEGLLKRNAGTSDDDLKVALTTITLEDVKQISLEGLSDRKQSDEITFGARNRSNDNDSVAPPSGAEGAPSFKKRPPSARSAFKL